MWWTIGAIVLLANIIVVGPCIIKGIKACRKRKKRSYDWKQEDWRVKADPEFNEWNNQRP